MIFFIFVLSFTITLSGMIILNLENGMESTIKRVGADIIVVPDGYVSSLEDALFMGEPCTIYFEQSWLDKIKAVKGVEKTSSQLFLATLSDSDCCDNAVQIIAYDTKSDFTIGPWIRNESSSKRSKISSFHGNLADNQIIVGYNLKYEPGDIATYYNTEFVVTAKLEKTGMGYDNSVFLNYTTAYKLVQQPIIRNYFSIGDREDLMSMISIDVKEGYDTDEVANAIETAYKEKGISVYTSNKLTKGLSENIYKLKAYSRLLSGLLFFMSVIAVMSIFSITINERKREYGILKSLGAGRMQIIGFITGEAEIISLTGSITGCLFALIIQFIFGNFISVKLNVPYLLAGTIDIVTLFTGCILLSVLTGLFASVYSAVKLSSTPAYELIRENE